VRIIFYFPSYHTHHSPGMNRKIWGSRLILRPSPAHCGFCVSSRCVLNHKDTARRSCRPEHAFTISITQRFLGSLNNSVCGHKRNVLLLRVGHTCNVTTYRNAVTLQVTYTIRSYELNFHPVPHGVTVSCERYTLGFRFCYGSPSDIFAASSGFVHLYTLRFKEAEKRAVVVVAMATVHK